MNAIASRNSIFTRGLRIEVQVQGARTEYRKQSREAYKPLVDVSKYSEAHTISLATLFPSAAKTRGIVDDTAVLRPLAYSEIPEFVARIEEKMQILNVARNDLTDTIQGLEVARQKLLKTGVPKPGKDWITQIFAPLPAYAMSSFSIFGAVAASFISIGSNLVKFFKQRKGLRQEKLAREEALIVHKLEISRLERIRSEMNSSGTILSARLKRILDGSRQEIGSIIDLSLEFA